MSDISISLDISGQLDEPSSVEERNFHTTLHFDYRITATSDRPYFDPTTGAADPGGPTELELDSISVTVWQRMQTPKNPEGIPVTGTQGVPRHRSISIPVLRALLGDENMEYILEQAEQEAYHEAEWQS